jgi:hypothetical protein
VFLEIGAEGLERLVAGERECQVGGNLDFDLPAHELEGSLQKAFAVARGGVVAPLATRRACDMQVKLPNQEHSLCQATPPQSGHHLLLPPTHVHTYTPEEVAHPSYTRPDTDEKRLGPLLEVHLLHSLHKAVPLTHETKAGMGGLQHVDRTSPAPFS